MKYIKTVLAIFFVLGLVGCKEQQPTENKSLEIQDVTKCEAREKNDILKNSKDSSPNIDNITQLNTVDKNNTNQFENNYANTMDFTIIDDTLLYVDHSEQRLKRYDKTLEEPINVSDYCTPNFIYVNNYVYFADLYEYQIYRCHIDGTNMESISGPNEASGNLYCCNNYIIFGSIYNLSALDLETNNITEIATDFQCGPHPGTYLTCLKNYIFYINIDNELVRIDMSNFQKDIIANNVITLNVYNNHLYYAIEDSNHFSSIYKMEPSESHELATLIHNNIKLSSFIINNTYLIYEYTSYDVFIKDANTGFSYIYNFDTKKTDEFECYIDYYISFIGDDLYYVTLNEDSIDIDYVYAKYNLKTKQKEENISMKDILQ